MARRKKYDDEISKNSGSVGYSQAALKKLNAGTYGRDIGSKRQVQYRTSQEQTQQSRQLPVLEGLTRSNDWESSFGHDKLNRASQYQQNLANEAAKYTYNESLAKANTLDKKDQGYLQRLVDNFGDGDVTRDALKTSTHTKDWEKKYGKSYDEIYRDFLADQGNAKMRQGQAHPILSEISTALGSLNTPLTTIPSLIANAIVPDSKVANVLEDTRSRYENQRKLLRAGVKERTGDKGDKVIDTVNAVADRMIPTIAGNAIGGNVLGGVLAGASDANRRMDELNLRPDLDNRRKALTALGQGAVEGVGTAITSGLLDKIPSVGGIGGRLLNVGKGAGNAAIENSISEAFEMGLDTAINRENSAKELNKAVYMLNGMSEEDATAQARKDQLGQVGSAALTGALFGGGMRGLSEIFDSVRRLPTLTDSTEPLTNDAMVDIIARDNRYKAEFTARTGIRLGDSVEDNKAIITDYLMSQAQPNRIGMNEVEPDNRVAAESAPETSNVQKIENAIKEKDFKPITFNNPKGESYLITKSTRPGEKWQLSFISDTGNPTGHTAFRSDEDLIKELSKLKDENIRNLGTNDNVFSQASTTVGEMLENPDNYTLEDFQRVVRAYDVNADVDGATKEDIIDFMSNVVAEDPDYATASAIVNRLGDSVESSFSAVDGVIPNRTMNESVSQNPTLTQEVRGLAGDDLKVAQAQQAQAVDNINRLSEQIPDVTKPDISPSIHNADGQLLDTVKVPEYTADSNVFFKGTDADISLAEAQDKSIIDTFKNIVSDPEFNALSFKNGKQEVYVSPSTVGNGYRVSYTIDGVPTGHHDYSVGEMDALSQNLRELAGNGGEDIRIQRKSDISRTQGTAPVDLKAAQNRVASNKSKIRALENEIKIIESDPNNKYRGNLKKSAKADIESRKAQIAELKQDNKVTTRQIKGEPTPVIEQLDADSVTRINDFKKEVRKIGNMWGGEGGKQLAKDVNDALDRYIESGSQEDFNTFARDLWQLHSSANGEYTSKAGNVSRYSDYYGDIEDGIFGASIKDNGMLPQKAIRDFHNARTMNESVGGNPTLTSEVPPTNPPMPSDGGNVPPETDISRRYETLKKSDLFTKSEANMKMLESAKEKGVFNKDVEARKVAQDEALQEYLNDKDAVIAKNLDKAWDSGKDVDTSMLILQDALDSGDNALTNLTLSKQVTKGKEAGRQLRAMRDYAYAGTKEGTITKAAEFLNDKADEILSSRKTAEQFNAIAERILNGDLSDLDKRFNMDDINIQNIKDALDAGAGKADIAKMIAMYQSVGKTGISPEAIQQINDIYNQIEQGNFNPNSKARADLEADAFKVLANDIGGKRSWKEMWDSWRYLAMLGNPKTHLRNVLGNATHYMVTEAKDNIGAVIEGVIDKASRNGIERTKSILSPADRGLIDIAAKDADDVAYASLADAKNKYDVKDEISRARNSFNSKILTKIDDLNSNALDLEDYSALKRKYSKSLARFLKANGADESIFNATDDASKALLDKGRAYAIDQAKQATFHEYSKMAQTLNQLSKNLSEGNAASKAGGMILEGLLPFKKTPINILKQGIKYSPVSIAKSVGTMVNAVKTGNKSAADAIEDLASGLTGTGIMAMGALLANQGLLTGGANENYDVDTAETEQGAQNYALKIGNNSYTLDWLAPMSLPLFVGAELMNKYSGDSDSEEGVFDRVISALSTIGEPITEMSMLQGIQNILNELSYSTENVLATFGTNATLGYASQAIPTLAGQFARAIDDTRRSTYTDKPAGFKRQFDKTLTKVENKIPFLSMTNEPYVNASGNTQQNEGLITSIFGNGFLPRLGDQMLSPGYYKQGNVTPVDEELNRLYEATGENVYKNVSSGKVNNEKLSKEKFTDYQKLYGSNTDTFYNGLVSSENYKNLDDAARVKALSDAKSISKMIADYEVGGRALKDSEQKVYDIYKKQGADGIVQYINDKQAAKSLDMSYENYVKKEAEQPGGAQAYVQEKQAAVDSGFVNKSGNADVKGYEKAISQAGAQSQKFVNDLPMLQQTGLEKSAYYTYANAINVIPSLTPSEFAQTYNEINTNTSNAMTQKELLDYLNKYQFSDDPAEDERIANELWRAYGGWKNKAGVEKKIKLQNGQWKSYY